MNQNRFCGTGYFDSLGAVNRLYLGSDQTETDDVIKISNTKTDPSTYFTAGWMISTIGLTGNSATAIAQGVRAEGKITSAFNLTSVDYGLRGITGIATHAGSGAVDRAVGMIGVVQTTDSGIVDRGFATISASGDNLGPGEITYLVGHGIANQSAGSHNTLLLMGTLTPPTGNYAIYNSSTYPNYMYGATTFAGTVTINTLTSGRVPYASTSGLLVDSANMTFDGSRFSLAATGSSGGVRLGGDADLYRDAASRLRTPGDLRIDGYLGLGSATPSSANGIDNHRTLTVAGNFNGFRNLIYMNTTWAGGYSLNGSQTLMYLTAGISSGPSNFVTGSANTIYDQGVSNYSHYIVGLTGDVRATSSRTGNTVATFGGAVFNAWIDGATGATWSSLFGGRFDALVTSASSSGTISDGAAGVFRFGQFAGAATTAWTSIAGLSLVPYLGGAMTTWAGITTSTPSGTGNITTGRWINLAALPPITANNQVRVGIDFAAIPDPGPSTGTTSVAIRFTSGTTARDGLLWGTDTNLYRSAADTLKTDDKFWCNSLQVGTSSTVGQALCASDTSGNVTFQTVVQKRSIVVTLCGAFTPAGTGGDTFEFTMPYSPANGTTSITWNMRRITLRVNVAGGAPAATIEKSTATGAFSATTMGSVTMGSGNYEVSATSGFSSSTIASGDKLRFNATALGTATGWTITVLFEEN